MLVSLHAMRANLNVCPRLLGQAVRRLVTIRAVLSEENRTTTSIQTLNRTGSLVSSPGFDSPVVPVMIGCYHSDHFHSAHRTSVRLTTIEAIAIERSATLKQLIVT